MLRVLQVAPVLVQEAGASGAALVWRLLMLQVHAPSQRQGWEHQGLTRLPLQQGDWTGTGQSPQAGCQAKGAKALTVQRCQATCLAPFVLSRLLLLPLSLGLD